MDLAEPGLHLTLAFSLMRMAPWTNRSPFLREWRRCVCREAQVTLIELNRVTEKIRARKRTGPKHTKPNNKHHKPPKQPNRQTGLISHQDCQSRSDCLEIDVKRGIEFILLSALSRRQQTSFLRASTKAIISAKTSLPDKCSMMCRSEEHCNHCAAQRRTMTYVQEHGFASDRFRLSRKVAL